MSLKQSQLLSLCLATGCFFISWSPAQARPDLPGAYCEFAQQMLPTARRIVERNQLMQREMNLDLSDLPATELRCDWAFQAKVIDRSQLNPEDDEQSVEALVRTLPAWEVPFTLGERSLALLTIAPGADGEGLVMESFGRAPSAEAFDEAKAQRPEGELPEVIIFPEARIRFSAVRNPTSGALVIEPISAQDRAQWHRFSSGNGRDDVDSATSVTIDAMQAVFAALDEEAQAEASALNRQPPGGSAPGRFAPDVYTPDRLVPNREPELAAAADRNESRAQVKDGRAAAADPANRVARAQATKSGTATSSPTASDELPEESLSIWQWLLATIVFVGINVGLYKGTRWYLRRRWLDGV